MTRMARSSTQPEAPTAPMVRLKMNYQGFKTFFKDANRAKALLHVARRGYHTVELTLPGGDAGPDTRLVLTVKKEKAYLRRGSDNAPRNEYCPLGDANLKAEAEKAMSQSKSVKQAFADAFPSKQLMDAALDALCDMLAEKLKGCSDDTGRGSNDIVNGIYKNKVDRLIANLKSRKQPADRALNALWACMPYTQTRMMNGLPDYTVRYAYFKRIRKLLESSPPRLADIAEFAQLFGRVHGSPPPTTPSPPDSSSEEDAVDDDASESESEQPDVTAAAAATEPIPGPPIPEAGLASLRRAQMLRLLFSSPVA